MIFTEEYLDNMLSTPSPALVADMQKIEGDICILGAGGKMGPTLALLAVNACKQAGIDKKIWAVSRFSNSAVKEQLEACGVHTISIDLTAPGAMKQLPDVDNIIYMAGRKFGTDGNEHETWNMNVSLPTLVTRRFRGANIVVFSSGNIYPQVPVTSGGCSEKDKPSPIGEYCMSTLGRERVFEHATHHYGTKALMYRLNYAVDLRYGVLFDLARKIVNNEPIDLSTGNFNCVWQGYANEVAIRSLLHTDAPASILNITGPETASVRYVAQELAHLLQKEVTFTGEEIPQAYLNNAARCFDLFGYPTISLQTLIQWQASWVLNGGKTIDAPTHFEERTGSY